METHAGAGIRHGAAIVNGRGRIVRPTPPATNYVQSGF